MLPAIYTGAVDLSFPERSLSRQSTAKTMAGTLDFFMSLLAGAAQANETTASPAKKAGLRTPAKR